MHQLRNYFNTQNPFSADDLERIEAAFVPKIYRKGEFLIRAGQTDRYVWFIERGVIRLYEEAADATEHTFYFMNAGQLVADVDSFHGQVPSGVTMQAVTDCHTRAVSYDGFQRLVLQVPPWNSTIQRITERTLLEKVQKRNRLFYEDAKARYVRLLAEQPEVAQQVPLGMIASYLGITLPSLSRLRKQLAIEHA